MRAWWRPNEPTPITAARSSPGPFTGGPGASSAAPPLPPGLRGAYEPRITSAMQGSSPNSASMRVMASADVSLSERKIA